MGRPVVIRGGTVIDGTGAPRRRADVAWQDGVIAAVGDVAVGPDAEVVDATDLVVAPGFVDIHTHFDAQVMWDPDFTPSSWHGVSTVIQGNTGFGIAPTRPVDREHIMQTLENVEGMNLATLRAGIPWQFETFPEYVAAVRSARARRLNLGMFVGHTPLRMYVMGFEDATSREATGDEIAEMSRLLEEALRSGAIGFSTSLAPSHVGALGRPVPSRVASREEIRTLIAVVGRSPHPLVEITYGPQFDLVEVAEMSKELGVRFTWGSLLTGLFGASGRNVEMLEAASAVGGDVWPQVSCREIVLQTQMSNPYYFGRVPAYQEFFSLPDDQRAAKYGDLGWRERVKKELPAIRPQFAELGSVAESDAYPELIGRPIGEVAAERGVHPFDLIVDLALGEELTTRFRFVTVNGDVNELSQLLHDPRTLLGAHDAGAHANMLCDACYPTHLLATWVRDRGVLSLEEAVWRLSGQPAEVFGLADRGTLQPGKAADVVVFDPETVAPRRMERVYDLPGAGERLIVRSDGVVGLWVNGTRVFDASGHDDADVFPGVLVA